jgi:predicted secreted protein
MKKAAMRRPPRSRFPSPPKHPRKRLNACGSPEAPAEAAEASAEAPAEAAEACLRKPPKCLRKPSEAPAETAEASEAPAEAAEMPAEAAEVPAEAVKAPAETVEAPIAATQASIKAPEAPAETAEAPEAPAEAAETAEAPAEAADQTESLDSLLRSVNSVLDLDGIRQRADSTAPKSNAAPLKIAVKEPEVAASVQPETQGSAPDSKKKKKKRVTLLILIGVLAALLVGIYFFLWKWYFIEVNAITLVSKGYDRITVSISANVSDPDLTVTCRDAYGNSYDGTKSADGISFTGLTSNTQYTIELSANENHRLTRSSTSRVDITTYESTSIAQLSVKLGEKEGTAEVSVDFDSGLEPDTYLLSYVCDGEAEKTETFTGSTCTLTDLKLNADYTFRLEDHGNYFMVGQTTAQAKILPPVQAENLHIVSIEDGVMEVAWDCGTENAAGWTVTCTDGGKYSEQVDSESCSARFSGTSTSQEYTVKVTSATLYNPLTLTVDSDPMIVKNLAATAEGTKINVSWDSLGGTPEGGWQIEYQIDTADGNPSLTTSDTNSAVLSNVVPNAAYTITLKAEDGHTTVGNLTVKVSTGAAEAFDSYSVSSDNVIVGLYARPSATNWTYRDLSQYKTSYSAGEAVAFALQITGAAETSDDKVVILTVVRNSAGDPLYVYCSEPNASTTWNEMWTDSRYVGEVEAPQSAGSYTLEVYLNGRLLESTDFTVA